MSTSDNRRIIKNTGMLYVRMLFLMGVSLYTSRIILDVLGIEDYGIYNIVGGIVALFSFLKNALSISTSRFLTFEIGRKDFDKLKETFSSSYSIHIFLAILVFIIAETIGLWFLYNKIVIPPERLQAAVWTYHFSVLTSLVTIIQVPYNAAIIAHEKMDVYAYISIIEVILNLSIVYLLYLYDHDKLIFYAVLMLVVRIIIAFIYRFYCIKNYKECRYKYTWKSDLYKSIAFFSGWSLLGSLNFVLLTQGSNILLNLFFGPLVNAAYGISIQVNTAVNLFVKNFQTASRPQIVKLYADNRKSEMKTLVINTTRFSYFLLLILTLPVILETKIILELWLKEIPEHAVIFVQLILIDALITTFDSSLYFVFNAMGRLKENAIISPIIGFLVIPVSFILFRLGFEPSVIFYVQIVKSIIMSIFVKPILLYKYADYILNDFISIFLPCIIVTIIAITPPLIIHNIFSEGWQRLVYVVFTSLVSVSISTFFIGISKANRIKIIYIIRKNIINR